MEYLTFKFGFCIKTSTNVYPCVQIFIDQVSVIDELWLDQAGSVDDPLAKMQYITIQSPILDSRPAEHVVKIKALNINDNMKKLGDFGFQVRQVSINDNDSDSDIWDFFQNNAVFRPIYSSSYITEYMIPADKLNELEYINNYPFHVERGRYANYVNAKDGWYELPFATPLYEWVAIKNNFGDLHRWLIKDR